MTGEELREWERGEVSLTRETLRALVDAAVRGYNAELRYKSLRRRDERDSERAMRLAETRAAIESTRKLVAPPDSPEPPRPIE